MKFLTILNTIAIIVLFYFGSQNGLIVDQSVVPEEEVAEEVEDGVPEETETDEEDSEENEEEEEGTLSLDESNMPNGFVDLTGYLTIESTVSFGETVEQAFFAFNETSDEDIQTFINELILIGNTVNRRMGSTYMLGLGCDTGETIDNLNFNVSGENYTTLANSGPQNLVTLRAFFNSDALDAVGGACLSFAETVQIVNEP